MSENINVNFWVQYSTLCLKSKVCPLKSVFKRLKGTELGCPVEAIRCEHWPFFLAALCVDNSLTKIHFGSNISPSSDQYDLGDKRKQRKHACFPLPYGCSARNISDICMCLSHVLSSSSQLKVLKIENLRLKKEDAQCMANAFKNSTIQLFSMAGCQIQDEAVEIICRGLQSSNITWVDFSSCSLSTNGLKYVCNLIKANSLKSSSDMFPHTLRSQLPVWEAIKGLNRISLNNNEISNEELETLMETLSEDTWIKALDLQKCSIDNYGAKAFLKLIKSNPSLELIDLRLNDFDDNIMDRITLQMALNNIGKAEKHQFGSLWKPLKMTTKIPKHKSYLKTKVVKQFSTPQIKVTQKNPAKISIKITDDKTTTTGDASSQTAEDFSIHDIYNLRKALTVERKARKHLIKLVKRYKMENQLLQTEVEKLTHSDERIFIDHETYTAVKNTFEKFKRFLCIMKEYGLWDCITRLGINEEADGILKQSILDIAKQSGSDQARGTMESSQPISSKTLQHDLNFSNLYSDAKLKNRNEIDKPACYSENNITNNYLSEEKALVQRVFKEVRDNYSNSYLTHTSNLVTAHPKHHLHKKEKYLHPHKTSAGENVQQKSTSSQTKQYQDLSHLLVIDSEKVSTIGTSANSVDTSDLAHTLYEESINKSYPRYPQSVKSKASKESGSNQKTNKVPDLFCHKSKSTLYSSKISSSSIAASEKQTSSETVEHVSSKHFNPGLASSKQKATSNSSSKERTKSQENSPFKNLSSSKQSFRSSSSTEGSNKSQEKHLSSKASLSSRNSKLSSRVSSENSVNTKSGAENKSSDSDDSGKSYLESVSEASTDKDVKTLTESEVYSSGESEENHKVLTQSNTQVPLEQKQYLGSKDSTYSGNSKSPKSKQAVVVKSMEEKSGPKLEDGNPSDKSMPSLSDITTVSSHSLNTDSVLNQLSEN